MAYQIIHLENLTELKTRVGGTTTPTLATILGLNYPAVEGFRVYVWDNNANDIADDNNIVRPNPRATLPGRWFNVDLSIAPHNHPINQIIGLQNQLDTKIEIEEDPSVGNHIKAITENNILNWNNKDYNNLTNIPSTFAPSAHLHSVSEVINLQSLLDNKASVSHTHSISQVINLQTNLDSKQNTILASRLTNWDTAFEWGNHAGLYKSITYIPTISEISGLQTTLDSKANTIHSHNINDVTGLQNALDNKSNISHTHTIAQISNLQSSLDNKANVSSIPVINNYNTSGSKAAFTKIFSERIPVTSANMTINLASAGFTSTNNMIFNISIERLGTTAGDAIDKKIRSFTTTQAIIDLYQPVAIVLGGLGVGALTTFTNTWLHIEVKGN